ncbi:MAG: hypothetical protein INR70_13325 [Parafilimonas terrae]|nr:hypothetical protein [Parafilimonas terrae]
MSRIHTDEHCLSAEFAALVAHARDHRDGDSRQDLFTALLALERRAGLAGVSDRFLRRVAEARFLAGILRESVVPVQHAGQRATQQALTEVAFHVSDERDFDVIGVV